MKHKKYSKNGSHDVDYNPINKNRGCTDILCLLLFLAFLGGWAAIAAVAFINGDPQLLVYPSNSEGDLCGIYNGEDRNFTDRGKLLFFDITRCFGIQAILGCPTHQVCVDTCPTTGSSLYLCTTLPDRPCQYLISGNYRDFCNPLTDDEWEEGMKNPMSLITSGKCPPYILPSVSVIDRCVPDFGVISGFSSLNDTLMDLNGNPILANTDTPITVNDVYEGIKSITEILNLRGITEKLWADVVSSWYWILAGLGVSLVIAFTWMFLMRFITGIMIWLSALGCIGVLVASCVYTGFKYFTIGNTTQTSESIFEVNPIEEGLQTYLALRDTWLVFFIASCVLLVIILLILLFLRSRIAIAIQLIGESSKAVGSAFSSLFFPILPFILQIGVVGFFGFVAAFLASARIKEFKVINPCDEGNETISCDPDEFPVTCSDGTVSECKFDKYTQVLWEPYLQVYNFVGLLWGFFYLSAFGEMVLAGTFASWYWALDKSKDVPSFPVIGSLYRTIRYHVGTLALGSLIVTIIRLIRISLQWVEHKLKEAGQDNIFVKAGMCLCKCCLWCLEKFIKFINRNAYIVTASTGRNFCSAAVEAFNLIARNCIRAAVLDKVTDFLLFMGKCVVVGGATVLSYYWFSGGLDGKIPLVASPSLNYYFAPIILVAVSSYYVASIFFSVYSMAVDTIFLCFLVDLEQNDGKDEPQYYMSRDLMKILSLKNKRKKSY